MREAVIVEAVRTPFGKRNGGLSQMHSIDLLGTALRAVIDRSGVDPATVGQVVGGCVGQVGIQTLNISRNAWLAAGLPLEVAATTVDSQCGSSQQASTLAYAMVAGGLMDVAVACGVELMSKVPMGSSVPKEPNVGKPLNRTYREQYEATTQFESAERIADKWGITRADCDAFGLRSQQRAATAVDGGHFDTQLAPVRIAERDADGKPTGAVRTVEADEGPRATTLDTLGTLKPTGRPDGVHTAGTSSQISDGASAVVMMTRDRAESLGLEPLATIVDACCSTASRTTRPVANACCGTTAPGHGRYAATTSPWSPSTSTASNQVLWSPPTVPHTPPTSWSTPPGHRPGPLPVAGVRDQPGLAERGHACGRSHRLDPAPAPARRAGQG